ncbi:hypothetical protein V7x_56080 [Crateriforma conspicua]|uniref:Uncharacterized protein n=2 Tax=Crateriforma conspicua TaxID=2527996 RepID=A0A5C6FDF6_9PLAN|nr:hypothetical protein V7x_56080 [Crateriforma conspicua]
MKNQTKPETTDSKQTRCSSHCSVAEIYKALDAVGEQIARSEALLKTWPHAQSGAATVETQIGELRYERPYLIVDDGETITRSTELPSAWRVEVARSVPRLIKQCEKISDQFLSDTQLVAKSLRECLDQVE